MKKLILGNWKMNKLKADVAEFMPSLLELVTAKVTAKGINSSDIIFGVAPPLTLLQKFSEFLQRDWKTQGITFLLGAQNAHWQTSGAYTGEVSLAMLQDFGVNFVILGHSERRQFFGETDKNVSLKTASTLKSGLTAVVCIGESLETFQAKKTKEFLSTQLRQSLAGIESSLLETCSKLDSTNNPHVQSLVIAYEPCWAIGTGIAATEEIILSVHGFIREELNSLFSQEHAKNIPILYGGSVNPANIKGILKLENVGGALVGGASLEAKSFYELVSC